MKNLKLNLVFIVLIFCLTFYIIFPWTSFWIDVPKLWEDFKLWLDLHWWVELDYKVDFEEAKKKWEYDEKWIIDWLKTIIEKRVNALGTAEPTILTSKYGQESHIIVQIPTSNFAWQKLTQKEINDKNNEFITKAKENIGKVVRLEFKEKKTEITDTDKAERRLIIENVKKELGSEDFDFKTIANKYKDQNENVIFQTWSGTRDQMPLEASFSWMENVETPYISDILDSSQAWSYSIWEDGNLVAWESEKGYSIVKINSILKEEKEREVSTGTWIDVPKQIEKYTSTVFYYEYIFVSQKPSEWTAAKSDGWDILDERYLINAIGSMNQLWQPEVELTFNSKWATIFAELTKRLIGKQIAIFVWWELLTAPTVNSVIPDGKAVITGNYTIESAKKLANDIKTWIVPAPIYLTSERAIDAKIGWDSLDEIYWAWLYGFVFILMFLILVYRFSGLFAWIALIGYIMITLALVKIFWVVLTLASIAWLILSIWLAIDANILIFERTKEELRNWLESTKAINIWFDRSWTAIWDSHVTSFVSAVILYLIWVNLIKGFGLMLGIGIIVSLFSAMWISRILILAFAPMFNKNLSSFIGLKK